MPVEERETVIKKSHRDVERHQEKRDKDIRKHLYHRIAKEDIITGDRKKKVKVSVKVLKSYRFIFERGGGGVGQGPGEGEGKPGDQPGEETFDTEMELEKLIDMFLEECGLPNLKEKKAVKIITSKEFKYEKIDTSGPKSLMEKRKTLREAIKRQKAFIRQLMRLTGFTQKECERILIKANGSLPLAYELVAKELARVTNLSQKECLRQLLKEDKTIKKALQKIRNSNLVKKPIPRKKVFIHAEDERYKVPEEEIEFHSNAVCFAIRDASGSMGDEKKAISRILLFWLVEALRKLYENVEIRFILHTTEAELVSEHDFFYRSESGGTYGGSGYALASELEKTKYPESQWNIYPFHFSDGEDFQPERTVEEALKLLEKSNMLGYGEIQPGGYTSWSELLKAFERKLGVSRKTLSSGIQVVEKMVGDNLFLGVVITKRDQLGPVLREFLKEEREVLK